MSHDPQKVKNTKAWLEKVMQDIRVATLCLEATSPLVEASLFHSQQAVEKSFKAFLTWHDEPFKKTHDIGTLGDQASELDPSLKVIAKKSESFTEFAWKFRYSKSEPVPSLKEALNVLKIAEEVYAQIISKLPKDL